MNTRTRIIVLLSALTMAFGLSFGAATIAQATEYGGDDPGWSACKNLDGWFVNAEDEGDRKPTPTVYGLKFSGSDLIHHAANVALADLEPGTYAVHGTATPDQPSFFSVEVRNTGGAYGTLRWIKASEKWSITIGSSADGTATAGTFEGADPVELLTGKVTKWGAFDPATAKVVTFGVGYTKTPPGTVDTVISSVTFQDITYGLNCPAPTTQPTTKPTTVPTNSSSAAPTGLDESDVAGPSLPVTGPSTGLLLGSAATLLFAGVVLLVVFSRKRRGRFDA